MSDVFGSAAFLTRELHARVIDVSASGCLVETTRPLEVGTVGHLRVILCGEECVDDIEVTRCEAIEGLVTSYRVGARLLWTTPRRPGSIRHAVASQVGEGDKSDTTRVM
jgi:hypothetical protein